MFILHMYLSTDKLESEFILDYSKSYTCTCIQSSTHYQSIIDVFLYVTLMDSSLSIK